MWRSQFGGWLVKAGGGKAGGKTCATRAGSDTEAGDAERSAYTAGADVDAEAAGEPEGFAEAEEHERRG